MDDKKWVWMCKCPAENGLWPYNAATCQHCVDCGETRPEFPEQPYGRRCDCNDGNCGVWVCRCEIPHTRHDDNQCDGCGDLRPLEGGEKEPTKTLQLNVSLTKQTEQEDLVEGLCETVAKLSGYLAPMKDVLKRLEALEIIVLPKYGKYVDEIDPRKGWACGCPEDLECKNPFMGGNLNHPMTIFCNKCQHHSPEGESISVGELLS